MIRGAGQHRESDNLKRVTLCRWPHRWHTGTRRQQEDPPPKERTVVETEGVEPSSDVAWVGVYERSPCFESRFSVAQGQAAVESIL